MSTTETPENIVRDFMSTLDNNDLETATSYLADTFVFSGWTPKPLDKAGFLDVIKNIKEGIPGLSFNLHNVLAQNTEITGVIHITGYQTDSFIIPSLGTPPIPQTANSISLPTEDVTYQLAAGQISSMHVQHVPGGGVTGLIKQLGIDLPIMQ